MLFNAPTVRVYARAAYPSWKPDEHEWRSEDYAANFFTHTVKRHAAKLKNRYASLPFGPGGAKLNYNKNSHEAARAYFPRWAAERTRGLGISDPIFIAVPNSDALPDSETFNIAELARSAAQNFGAGAGSFDGLRFKVAIPKEERDHRLSVAELRANMVLTSQPPAGTPVLIDDVFTQGFHISACVLELPEDRRPTVAMMASRTVNVPPNDPWDEIVEDHYCFG